MFKRFADLNTRNLLYMQAELIYLKQQLNVITNLDSQSAIGQRKEYIENALSLFKAGKKGESRQ